MFNGLKEERDQQNNKTGKPERTIGISNETGDQAKLRLENMIRDGLAPRLKVQIKSIDGFTYGPVVVIRIPQSFSAPHMVISSSRFYSRNSAGKYPLDVGEIRSSFLLSEALPERIKRFREQRLFDIVADQTPVHLVSDRRTVIHLIPISSFLHGSKIIETSFCADQKIMIQKAVPVSNQSINLGR